MMTEQTVCTVHNYENEQNKTKCYDKNDLDLDIRLNKVTLKLTNCKAISLYI